MIKVITYHSRNDEDAENKILRQAKYILFVINISNSSFPLEIG